MTNAIRNRSNEKGAIALEYILIAALVAIALIASFMYFRDSMSKSVTAVSDTTTNAVTKSIETGTAVKEGQKVNTGTF